MKCCRDFLIFFFFYAQHRVCFSIRRRKCLDRQKSRTPPPAVVVTLTAVCGGTVSHIHNAWWRRHYIIIIIIEYSRRRENIILCRCRRQFIFVINTLSICYCFDGSFFSLWCETFLFDGYYRTFGFYFSYFFFPNWFPSVPAASSRPSFHVYTYIIIRYTLSH